LFADEKKREVFMADALERKLRSVRIKCSVNLLLEQAASILLIAGLLAVLGILIQRFLGFMVINIWEIWALWATVAILIIVLWLYRLPNPMNTSVLIDNKLKLQERFSTTLALAGSDDPFAQAARIEAHNVAEKINPARQFPLSLSEKWLYAGTVWLSFALFTTYLPQKDLLGFIKHNQEKQQQVQVVELTQKNIIQAAKDVTAAVSQLNDTQLDSETAKLAELPKDLSPDDAKRQAIQKLGNLADKVKQMQAAANLNSVDLMKNMLKQLHGSQGQETADLKMAMAKGDFARAANLLEKLQKQLEQGSLSGQQKKNLTEQLQTLAKELQQLAEKNGEFEKELEKIGIDKALAKMDKQQLQQALQNKGLSPEKIEQLMQKMEACKSASGKCSRLGNALGVAGMGAGGAGSNLADAIDELSSLENLQQQLNLSRTTLDQIENAQACLGKGMCQGIGMQQKSGTGLAPGWASSSTHTAGPQEYTANAGTQIKDQTQQGPVIASWYFKGDLVKGEAKRDFSSVIQSARDSAAEAINENQIPKKYEETVKNYFGRLEQSADKK
jgi:hypothetical protein